MIKGGVKGALDEKAIMKSLESGAISGASLAVQESVLLLHKTTVKLIKKPSSGQAQVRYRPKRSVTASKPGDSPNSDTGRLIQSMKFEFNSDKTTGYVGSNLEYASHLEFGTKRMEARPFLSVASKQIKKDMKKIFEKHVNSSIKKGIK